MSHPYTPVCDCRRCLRERARRALQSSTDPRAVKVSYNGAKRTRPHRERVATRAEQHARYLDCGPGAWDDRDSGGDS